MMDIDEAWYDFEVRPFPEEWFGRSVADVALEEVDAQAAGCISLFLANEGDLDEECFQLLKEVNRKLDRILPALEGEARTYFEDMKKITDAVAEDIEGKA